MKSLAPRSLVAMLVLCAAPRAMAQTPEQPPAETAVPPAAETPPPPPAEALPPAMPERVETPPPPAPTPPPPPPAMEMPPPPPPMVAPAPKPISPPVTSKFAATFYGFVEWDSIFDSTQSFNDLAGNGAIARAGTYAGDHHRMMESVRNSRLGFKLKGPETDDIKSSAIAEMDFLGNQPQGSPSPTGSPAVSEGSYFTSPTFRIRHFALKMETPYIDVLAGQYWQLFGWQSAFHPNTVEYQGIPGQVYSRAPQLRLSHTFKTDEVNVDVAVAGSRPVQRDAYLPDGQAGIKLTVNNWKGLHTGGATGTALDGLGIGVSGVLRRFLVPEFSASPTSNQQKTGWGISADALIPVIPATSINDGNALTLTGSFVYGQAIADLYTGLSGGASFAALPMGTYPQDIDNGLVAFTSDGVLHAIKWESFMVGAQYYFPTPIRMWVSANYTHLKSPNIADLMTATNATKLFNQSDWFDANYFVDATASIRFGVEYAHFHQNYLDGIKAHDHRVQFSGFYIF